MRTSHGRRIQMEEMTLTDVKKLCPKGMEDFIKRVIRGDERSSQLRKKLVAATSRDIDFLKLIEEEIGFEGTISVCLLDFPPLTEQQFRAPTEEEEKFLATIGKDCTPYLAISPSYWGSINLALITTGKIKPWYLAAQPNDTNKRRLSGRYRIDYALKKDGFEAIDSLSRYILRSFTAHSKLRNTGVRDYYQFCPVSRAWWRHRLAATAAALNGISEIEIHRCLTNKGIWYHISERGVSKLTVISDINIFSGLTQHLVSNKISSQKECEKITAFLGAQSTWRSLGAFTPNEVSSLISEHRAVC